MTKDEERQIHARRRGSRDPHYTQRRVVSRVAHRCSWGHCRRIPPGEPHLVVIEFPGGEAGYADAAGKPVSMRVCHDCARHGAHADLLCPAHLPLLTDLAPMGAP